MNIFIIDYLLLFDHLLPRFIFRLHPSLWVEINKSKESCCCTADSLRQTVSPSSALGRCYPGTWATSVCSGSQKWAPVPPSWTASRALPPWWTRSRPAACSRWRTVASRPWSAGCWPPGPDSPACSPSGRPAAACRPGRWRWPGRGGCRTPWGPILREERVEQEKRKDTIYMSCTKQYFYVDNGWNNPVMRKGVTQWQAHRDFPRLQSLFSVSLFWFPGVQIYCFSSVEQQGSSFVRPAQHQTTGQ